MQKKLLTISQNMNSIKLTQYSHGAGCGCKISPSVLSSILQTDSMQVMDTNLLVGNDSRDDAAVYDLGDGTALISTTDFFMPIVDDPFTFGRIAATNAISDIYAMGGKPILAIAVLGWPVNKLSPEIAREVLEGGRYACNEAGIKISGGHSIDSPEPIFGLAVNGRVKISQLKRNDSASEGCNLLLTKPLGVGVLSTAQKNGKLQEEHAHIAIELMTRLNAVGYQLADIDGVRAMTDVTGFGLLGHLTEMCEGSNLSAVIEYDKVPRISETDTYIKLGCVPGGTHRNWQSYGHHIKLRNNDERVILCDPQTSGGLLIAVEDKDLHEVKAILKENELENRVFGKLTAVTDYLITVV